jgi:hypothetical protein
MEGMTFDLAAQPLEYDLERFEWTMEILWELQ